MFACNSNNNYYWYITCIIIFKFFNHFNSVFWLHYCTLWLAINIFFFVEYIAEDAHKWLKQIGVYHKLYIIISNYGAVVGIHIWCLTILHRTWTILNYLNWPWASCAASKHKYMSIFQMAHVLKFCNHNRSLRSVTHDKVMKNEDRGKANNFIYCSLYFTKAFCYGSCNL